MSDINLSTFRIPLKLRNVKQKVNFFTGKVVDNDFSCLFCIKDSIHEVGIHCFLHPVGSFFSAGGVANVVKERNCEIP